MFDDIVEVAEVSWKEVNDYLAAGYRLLTVVHSSRTAQRPDKSYYTKKLALYVVGRKAETVAILSTKPDGVYATA